MLDAFLETIGTLAILASIAAKFAYFFTSKKGDGDAGQETLPDTASTLPVMRSGGRACRRVRAPVARMRAESLWRHCAVSYSDARVCLKLESGYVPTCPAATKAKGPDQ